MAPPNCLSIHTMFTHCVQHPCGKQLSCILVKPRQSLESLPQDGHSQKVTSVLMLCRGLEHRCWTGLDIGNSNQMVIKLEKSNMPSKDILLSQVFMAKPLKSMCLNNIWNLGSLYGLSITFMHQENKFFMQTKTPNGRNEGLLTCQHHQPWGCCDPWDAQHQNWFTSV